jgi:hypothetical protein
MGIGTLLRERGVQNETNRQTLVPNKGKVKFYQIKTYYGDNKHVGQMSLITMLTMTTVLLGYWTDDTGIKTCHLDL